MKTALIATLALSLAACSAVPSLQMSSGDAAATPPVLRVDDDRLHHRAFYEDEDATPAWMKAAPRDNR
jgi:hypothetical protein